MCLIRMIESIQFHFVVQRIDAAYLNCLGLYARNVCLNGYCHFDHFELGRHGHHHFHCCDRIIQQPIFVDHLIRIQGVVTTFVTYVA